LEQRRDETLLTTEMELRMVLNLLFEFLMYNSSDEQLCKEFTMPQLILMEEMCMKAIKDSLELQMVPIRKFLILFQIYLRCLFGKEPK
jgi:hypothetical protein